MIKKLMMAFVLTVTVLGFPATASQTSYPEFYGRAKAVTTTAFMAQRAQIEPEYIDEIGDIFEEMVRQGGLWRVHCNLLREREVCERIPYQPGDPR